MRIAAVFLAALGFALMCDDARADTICFNQVTSNSGQDLSGQFCVDVTLDATGVCFRFTNNGNPDMDATIADVFFRDTFDTYLNLDGAVAGDITTSGAGVAFTEDEGGGNVPGGVAWDADWEMNASPTANGVMDGEWVQVCFDWRAGFDSGDFSAVKDLVSSGDIAIHVRNVNPDNEFSETLVTAPEPGSIVLLGMGLAGIAAVRRRRRASA